MTHRIRVTEAALGAGSTDPRWSSGPTAFHHAHAWQALPQHPRLVRGRTLSSPEQGCPAPVERIVGVCRQIMADIDQTLAAGDFPLVLGDDHALAVGTWSAIARTAGAPIGLLWIDAQPDPPTPVSSGSTASPGRALACLLGRGDPRLLHLGLSGAQLMPEFTVVFGARSDDPEALEFLSRMGVRVLQQAEIDDIGFAAAMDEALAIVETAPNGFGVSLDLDALGPRTAPGIGPPEPDGLFGRQVLASIGHIADATGLRAMELRQCHPDRDHQGLTTQLIAKLLLGIQSARRCRA